MDDIGVGEKKLDLIAREKISDPVAYANQLIDKISQGRRLTPQTARFFISAYRYVAAAVQRNHVKMTELADEIGVDIEDIKRSQTVYVGEPGESDTIWDLACKTIVAQVLSWAEGDVEAIRARIISCYSQNYIEALEHMFAIARGMPVMNDRPAHPRDRVAAFNAITSAPFTQMWAETLRVTQDDDSGIRVALPSEKSID